MAGANSLLLFVSLGLLIIVEMFAIDKFRNQVNDTNESVQSQAEMGIAVLNPILRNKSKLSINYENNH